MRAFHSSYDELAFPGGLKNGLDRLKRLEPDAVEVAVRFMVADPWFFRSGYIKEELIRRLKHATLTPEQCDSLRSVVLRSVTKQASRMPRRLATLAPVVDSLEFRDAILEAAASSDPAIQLRANQVLHVLRSVRR